MKNIHIKIVVISLILMVKLSTVSAQESTTLQFMKGMPQSDLLNPALHNDSSKVVIGLPGFSGMGFVAIQWASVLIDGDACRCTGTFIEIIGNAVIVAIGNDIF